MLLQGHRRRGREKDVPLSFGDATTHFSLLPGTDRRDVEGERELAPVSAAPRSSPSSPHAFQAECLHFAAGRVRDSVSLVPGVGGKRSTLFAGFGQRPPFKHSSFAGAGLFLFGF